MGLFCQDVYEKITIEGLTAIKARYDAFIRSEGAKLGAPALSNVLIGKLDQDSPFLNLQGAIKGLYSALSSIAQNPIYSDQIDFAHCRFEKGEWIIQEDLLREQYSTRVDSPEKEEIYKAVIELREAHARLREALNKHCAGADLQNIISSTNEPGDRLLSEEPGGYLTPDFTHFNSLFKARRASPKAEESGTIREPREVNNFVS